MVNIFNLILHFTLASVRGELQRCFFFEKRIFVIYPQKFYALFSVRVVFFLLFLILQYFFYNSKATFHNKYTLLTKRKQDTCHTTKQLPSSLHSPRAFSQISTIILLQHFKGNNLIESEQTTRQHICKHTLSSPLNASFAEKIWMNVLRITRTIYYIREGGKSKQSHWCNFQLNGKARVTTKCYWKAKIVVLDFDLIFSFNRNVLFAELISIFLMNHQILSYLLLAPNL